MFENNANNAYTTPYGNNFVTMYGSDGTAISASQALSFTCSSQTVYTLSYAYHVYADDTGDSCTLSVTYGGAVLDAVLLGKLQHRLIKLGL